MKKPHKLARYVMGFFMTAIGVGGILHNIFGNHGYDYKFGSLGPGGRLFFAILEYAFSAVALMGASFFFFGADEEE